MKNRTIHFFILLIFSLIMFSFKSSINKMLLDFSLKNINGKILSTSSYKNTKGFIIVFTCNHCPFAKLYSKRLNDLNTKYSKLNVPLLAINSMDSLVYEEETFDLMQQKAKKDKFNFPYLQDGNQVIGKLFGAEHTPTAFVIWKEKNHWTIKYVGSIDDNGEHPEKAKPFIANAVDELLLNKNVTESYTESFGCRIFYRKN
jgi:peroxiredoxin